MKKIFLCSVLLSCFGFYKAVGQTNWEDVSKKVYSLQYLMSKSYQAKEIDKKVLEAIDEKTVNLLKDYYLYGHGVDEFGEAGLSDGSLQLFKTIFQADAKVTSDLDESKVGGLIPISAYLDKIKANFGKTGLHFIMEKPSIDKVWKDAQGNYRAEVSFVKTMYLSVNGGAVEKCEKGSVYSAVMSILFNPAAIDEGLITEVSAVLQGPCFVLKKQNKLAIGVGFGSGLPSFKASDNFTKNMGTLQLDVKSAVTFGLNATYLYLLSNTKKLYLKAGLELNLSTLSSEISTGNYLKSNEALFKVTQGVGVNAQFNRMVNVVQTFSETHQVFAVGVPIGIRKIFGNTSSKLSFGVDLDVVPNFVVSAVSSEWKGVVSYYNSEFILDGDKVKVPLESDNIAILGTSFGLKNNHKIETPPNLKVSSNLSFATAFGVIVQYQINKKLDFWIQPSVAYMFTPYLKKNDSNKFFLAGDPTIDGSVPDRINNGVTTNNLEDYTTGVKYLVVGLKTGVVLKL